MFKVVSKADTAQGTKDAKPELTYRRATTQDTKGAKPKLPSCQASEVTIEPGRKGAKPELTSKGGAKPELTYLVANSRQNTSTLGNPHPVDRDITEVREAPVTKIKKVILRVSKPPPESLEGGKVTAPKKDLDKQNTAHRVTNKDLQQADLSNDVRTQQP
ncbi:hypothetical protein C8R48DRAFT_675824 [Suillus tomentosus]|nr:hypothetical protein C8R48DRAFT_675824 [Suillus tomentosus]